MSEQLYTPGIPWTQFWDMHSGGRLKTKYHFIYIQAPEKEAKRIFRNRFGRDPENVTCHCCGEDYSIDQSDTLEEASAYHRNCAWDPSTQKWVEKQCERLRQLLGPKEDWEGYLEKYPNKKFVPLDVYMRDFPTHENEDVRAFFLKHEEITDKDRAKDPWERDEDEEDED